MKKSWLMALAALTLGCIVAFAIVEGMVLLLHGQQVKFPRHVVEALWGLRYNDPGSDYRHRSADGTWRFRINQQGLYFVSMRDELLPHVGQQQLYWHQSHFHWTPFAHDKSGRALARLILQERLIFGE